MEQFLLLACHHLRHRYSRPSRHDVGNILSVDFLLYQRSVALHVVELLLQLLVFILLVLDAGVAYFSHLCIVAVALSLVGLEFELLNVDFVLLNFVYQLLFGFPFSHVALLFLAQVGKLLLQTFHFVGFALFAFDCLPLDFELRDFADNFVKSLWHRVNFDSQFRGSLINKVNCLVGQETVGYIAFRKLHGGNYRLVHDTHFVMVLIAFLQTTQDGDAAQLVRLVDHDNLETTLQRFVLLEVLLILIERCRTDAPQVTPCQSRFQDICGIHGAFALSCTDKRVYLIDEEDNLAVAFGHLVDDCLQTFLKLTFVFGTSHKRTHIE